LASPPGIGDNLSIMARPPRIEFPGAPHTYVYDSMNRLVAVPVNWMNNGCWRYLYDAMNRRVAKIKIHGEGMGFPYPYDPPGGGGAMLPGDIA